MKTNFVNHINVATVLCFTLLLSCLLPIHHAVADEYEVGTQFGLSRLVPDEDSDFNLTITHLPTSFMYVGASPTSLYYTWYPSKYFSLGPEFSYGRLSVTETYSDESDTTGITAIYLGGRVAFFFMDSAASSPYLLGRVSQTILNGNDEYFFDDDEILTSFGLGVGYQWRIGSSFALRTEAQFQRVYVAEEFATEYALVIGIGSRFGGK